MKKATSDPAHYLILDSRHNLDEFTGKTLLPALAAPGKEETVKRGGAIPGAVFSPWSKYAGNKDGEADKPTLKDAAELSKQLEKLKKNGYDAGEDRHQLLPRRARPRVVPVPRPAQGAGTTRSRSTSAPGTSGATTRRSRSHPSPEPGGKEARPCWQLSPAR